MSTTADNTTADVRREVAKPQVLIVAPHIDDELIGCYSVLSRNPALAHVDVLYLEELTRERRNEVRTLTGHGWIRQSYFGLTDKLNVSAYNEVYVPSRWDWHPAHRKANAEWRKHATHFYSVDMARGEPLSNHDRTRKKQWLDFTYPSQKQLWESDAKYYLFEDIHESDYELYLDSSLRINADGHLEAVVPKLGDAPVHITVQAGYMDEVNAELKKLREAKVDMTMKVVVNAVASICLTGEISVSLGNYTAKFPR